MYDVLVVCATIQVVDGILEYHPQMVDRVCPGQPIKYALNDTYDVKEVYTASTESSSL